MLKAKCLECSNKFKGENSMKKEIKVGDWIKFTGGETTVVFKVHYINNENEAFWLKGDDRYFNLDYCTKLTQQQIDILGLDNA